MLSNFIPVSEGEAALNGMQLLQPNFVFIVSSSLPLGSLLCYIDFTHGMKNCDHCRLTP